MAHQTTMTKKGQITIPKNIRDTLGLRAGGKLTVSLEKGGRTIAIKPPQDFLAVARGIKTKKKVDPVRVRESLDKRYERH